MDLNFCDICNESVPQLDLDVGSARKLGGRVICASCEQAMSHEEETTTPSNGGAAPATEQTPAASVSGPFAAPPLGSEPPATIATFSPAPQAGSPAPQGGGRGGIFLIGLIAVASLIVSSVVTIELVERIQSLRFESRTERAQLESKLNRTRADLLSSIGELDRAQRTSLSSGMDSVRESQRTQSAMITAQLGQLESKLDELAGLTARVSELEGQSGASQASAKRLSADLSQLNREVNKLVERWMEAVNTGDVVAGQQPAEEADAEPAWMEHASRLSSPSAATRWNAVTALGDAKDEAVVPFLVGMLQDPDTFVRIATARILEDLGSMEAVGELIEALNDSEVVVREVVVTALRKITGENHRFDPAAPQAERDRRVKAWREWWKKHSS